MRALIPGEVSPGAALTAELYKRKTDLKIIVIIEYLTDDEQGSSTRQETAITAGVI